MKYTFNLNDGPFRLIEKQKKTIELRLYDERRQKLKINDEIEFINTLNAEKRLHAVIKNIFVFDNFEALYQSLPLDKCGYDDISKASYLDMLEYYPQDLQDRYQVVGIEIELKK